MSNNTKASVKVMLGWVVIFILFACIYGVGKLRQYLELKFNGGYEYYMLPPSGMFHTPVDESILGGMASGLFSILTLIVIIALFFACSSVAYKIGSDLLSIFLKQDKQ